MMTISSQQTLFESLLERSGVQLSEKDVATLRDLVKAMAEAASVVQEPLSPGTAPATLLSLHGNTP